MSVSLKGIIKEENIVFEDVKTMDETVALLCKKSCESGYVSCNNEFHDAILEREELISTGIGVGIAIPHAKLPSIDDFFIYVLINEEGINWNSLDGKPVKLVFFLGGPTGEVAQDKYRKIMAKLMLLIKNPERREKLFSAKDSSEVFEMFNKF